VTITSRAKLATALLALCVAASPLSAAGRYLLTGNAKGLWLVRRSSDNKAFDVLLKPVHEKWKWVTTEPLVGDPAVAAAVGERLHLLFAPPGGYLMLDAGGRDTMGPMADEPRWPAGAAPLAACEAQAFGESQTATILLVVPRPANGNAATRPDTKAPAKGQVLTTSKPVQAERLGVFQNIEGQWVYVADLPETTALPGGRVLAACPKDTLYVLICPAGAGANRLIAVAASGKCNRLALPAELGRARLLAAAGMSGRLAILYSTPPADSKSGDMRQLFLAILDPAEKGKKKFTHRPITRSGQPFELSAAAEPIAAPLADKLAIIWPDGRKIQYATADVAGQLTPARPLGILEKARLEGDGQKVLRTFSWVLFAAIVIPLLFLRNKERGKPVILPPQARPASLYKRLAAVLIDFIPFNVLGSAVFYILAGPVDPDQFLEIAKSAWKSDTVPNTLAYAIIGSLVLYTVYCMLMELRFGATLGKMLLKIRVANGEGARPSLRGVLLRNLIKLFEMSWPVLPLAVVLMLMNRNRQRLGDMIGRTVVLDSNAAAPADETPTPLQLPDDE